MAFPPRFLEDIKDRVGLAEIIGRRVKLVRKGREHLGLCPFHNEKTPSFTVSDDKGFYHCFGCGASGDIISFVMETEKLSFPETVEQLAGVAGLQMPEQSPEDRALEAKRAGLAEAVDAASRWFADRLHGADGTAGRQYLTARGLDEKTIAHFQLGFAPDSRDALKKALTGQGFAEDTLVEAGLLKRPDDGRATFDFFRDRVIFPIADKRGRIIAFGGRLLGDAKAAKYINSPDTPLFHKGRTLYNLDQAMVAVRNGAELVVAEGYMDVIALHRAGMEGAVAPLGTALTEDQITGLWRYADEPILCFDGDVAGGNAAARAADRALPVLRPGKSLRFAMLPPGKDPDDLIGGKGAAAMRRVLDDGRPMSMFIWEKEFGLKSLDTPERKADLNQRLIAEAKKIRDFSVQNNYKWLFKRKLADFNRSEWQASRGRRTSSYTATVPTRGALGNPAKLKRIREQEILAILILTPELADEFAETLVKIDLSEDLEKLIQAVFAQLTINPNLNGLELRQGLCSEGYESLVDQVLSLETMRQVRLRDSQTEMRGLLEHQLTLIEQAQIRTNLKSLGRTTWQNNDSDERLLATQRDAVHSERVAQEHAYRLWDAEDEK